MPCGVFIIATAYKLFHSRILETRLFKRVGHIRCRQSAADQLRKCSGEDKGSVILPGSVLNSEAIYRVEEFNSYCKYEEDGDGENITQFFSYDRREEAGLRVSSVSVG